MTLFLEPAQEADLPALATLMNAAYRGTDAERGWTDEGDYITGERTHETVLRDEIRGGALYLLVRDEATSTLQGCVSLQQSQPHTWYLGSLTVAPAMQNTGFGRRLLEAAEDYAAAHGATTIEMTVVHVRDTLIAWYERRGYRRTGESRPFPYGDDRFGTPQRDDLKFIVLERQVSMQHAPNA